MKTPLITREGYENLKKELDTLWREVNQSGGRNVFGDSAVWSKALTPDWLKGTPMWQAGQTLALSMSPYSFNPFNLNPLRRVLETAVDFEALRASSIQMFVSTTAVRAGRSRIFRSEEMAPEVLLASACLPQLFQAVEIEGEPYWDGGYLANPALWPLFYTDTPDDILLLPLNPFQRDETPREAGDINDRLNEIVFNAPLVAELRAVAFVQDLIAEGKLKPGEDRRRGIRIHVIEADEWLGGQSLHSKFDTEWSYLNELKQHGRTAADTWLETCLPTVGKASSVDVKARFL